MKIYKILFSLLATSFLLTSCIEDQDVIALAPNIETIAYSDLKRSSVILGSSINGNKISSITECGFIVGTSSTLDSGSEAYHSCEIGTGEFSLLVSDLKISETYFFCSYVSNGSDTQKSSIETFTTLSESGALITQPEDMSNNIVQASISDDGGATIQSVGFCWSESGTPTIRDSWAESEYIAGEAFDHQFTGYDVGTKLYVRAFADSDTTGDGSTTTSYSTELEYYVILGDEAELNITDEVFKAFLLANYDTDNNNVISIAECKAVTSMVLPIDGIESLSSLSAFSNLEYLELSQVDTSVTRSSSSDVAAATVVDAEAETKADDSNSSTTITSVSLIGNPKLVYFKCSDIPGITSLSLENNTLLGELQCSGNNLSSLDISSCTELTTLNCSDNPELYYIDVWSDFVETEYAQFTKDAMAQYVVVGGIKSDITTLEIPDDGFKSYLLSAYDVNSDGEINSAEASVVEVIYANTDNIKSVVGIEQFPNLVEVSLFGTPSDTTDSDGNVTTISNGALTSVDLSGLSLLESFSCAYNGALTTLDISSNSALTLLDCRNCNLYSLDISANTALTSLNSVGNKMLYYIDVWSDFSDEISAGYTIDSYTVYVKPGEDKPDVVNIEIPDANFKAYLVENFDTNSDGEIGNIEASKVTSIYVCTDDIESVVGLEAFNNLTVLWLYGTSEWDSDKQQTVYNGKLTTLDVSANTALKEFRCYYNQLTALDVSANTALKEFRCYSNQLTTLDVSANTTLTELYCHTNSLTALDVSANTALTYLSCSSNQFTSLDVSANTALTRLDCSLNQLTALDVSANTALILLVCDFNNLTALDVSANTVLSTLYCDSNQLTALDVSANTALTSFQCNSNQLTALDVSANTVLKKLWCYSNQLSALDISNNKDITSFDCRYNTNLYYVDVWEGFDIANYTNYYADEGVMYIVIGEEKPDVFDIEIPDANFKAYLVENFDTNNNGEIGNLEALKVTNINVCTDNIESVVGLEAFVNLTSLDLEGTSEWNSEEEKTVYNGKLTTLDVSANTGLYRLVCSSNQLTTLDVSANTKLTTLWCYNNSLTDLDVSANTSLNWLGCAGNNLTALDVSPNTYLQTLYCAANNLAVLNVSADSRIISLWCSDNKLTTIDVSACTELGWLQCSSNELTALDVSANTALTSLSCSSNQLTDLDVSANTALTQLWCSSNQLTDLDVSANTALTQLWCSSNDLSALDISNNKDITSFNCLYNENLYYIDVWEGFDIANYTDYHADAGVTYVVKGEDKPEVVDIEIPDANFKAYLVENFDTNSDGEINSVEALKVTNINVCTDDIESVVGLEAFTNLTNLYLNGTSEWDYEKGESVSCGKLTELNVSANTALTTIDCYSNQLTALDVSKNKELYNLFCWSNKITTLDVSANTKLGQFICNSNDLSTLDVSANTELTYLNCSSTNLSSIDLSTNTILEILYCYSNDLTALDISNNKDLRICNSRNNENLYYIDVWEGFDIANYTEYYADAGVTYVVKGEDKPEVVDIEIPDANFKAYLVENFDTNSDGEISSVEALKVTSINVSTDNIESVVGLEAFTNLTNLRLNGTYAEWEEINGERVYSGKLTELNISANTALTELMCYTNNLTSLDVSANTELTGLYCSFNQLTTLDVSANTALISLDCYDNQLTSLNVSANTALQSLRCDRNPLTKLDVSVNTALNTLWCDGNQLTTLDVSANTALTWIYCGGNNLTTLDVSANTELTMLGCGYNQLTALDLSVNTKLGTIYCYNNQLTDLDVSACTELSWLDCSSNQLTALDVSANTALTTLNCPSNNITTIYIYDGCDTSNFSKDDSATYVVK